MSEKSALLLAGLSHQWMIWVLGLVFASLAITIFCGRRLSALSKRIPSTNQRSLKLIRFTSLLTLLVGAIAAAAGLSHAGCASLKWIEFRCLQSEKELAKALHLFAQDYSERFPPSENWAVVIGPIPYGRQSFEKHDEYSFYCPAAESAGSYGLNTALARASLSKIDDPLNTVLLFEADAPTLSFSGGASEIALKRHRGYSAFAFADGHAKRLMPAHQNTLKGRP